MAAAFPPDARPGAVKVADQLVDRASEPTARGLGVGARLLREVQPRPRVEVPVPEPHASPCD